MCCRRSSVISKPSKKHQQREKVGREKRWNEASRFRHTQLEIWQFPGTDKVGRQDGQGKSSMRFSDQEDRVNAAKDIVINQYVMKVIIDELDVNKQSLPCSLKLYALERYMPHIYLTFEFSVPQLLKCRSLDKHKLSIECFNFLSPCRLF